MKLVHWSWMGELLHLTECCLVYSWQMRRLVFSVNFYRTMHYSTKCGLAIACCLSVRLSVMLVDHDHIRWKSWKLIARTISPTPSLFIAQSSSTYSQRTWTNFGEPRGGWEKVACWSTKAAISLKRVKVQEKLLWRAYRKSPVLFRMVPSTTPYDLPFPLIRVHNPQPKLQSLLSQERLRLHISNFLCYAHSKTFRALIYKVHCNSTAFLFTLMWLLLMLYLYYNSS